MKCMATGAVLRCMVIASLTVCAGVSFAPRAHAIEVSSRRLIENAKFYDGRTVSYKGEAVTAIMRRGDHAWLAVSDGDNTIGVWCRQPQVADIRFLGSYNTKGDTLVVVGVFNRACQEHGGELDIHADTVTVTKQGHAVSETVNKKKTRLAFFLFFCTILVVFLFRKRI